MPEVAFEPVIGLEVHAQLRTASKAFCACPVTFGAPPNTAVCPVCLGYPGTLPVANREMVALALRVALAAGCDVHGSSVFERKNYFYPDLPKGYQISQYERPLATGGGIAIGSRTVRLTRIHLEEDAGKSMHEFPWDDVPGHASLVDLNRAGTPLIEIVTEPDLFSPDEAHAYLTALRRLVRWVGASDGNMEEGSLRCDANVSVRARGAAALGTKVEIKNLNSIAHVKKALEHEIARQTALLASGATVVQETRLFEPGAGTTKTMRSKEEAMDYRYFPDPDLGTLEVGREWVEEVRAALPEMPDARIARLTAEYALPLADAEALASSRPLADFYEEAVAAYSKNPKAISNWLLSDLLGRMPDADRQAGRVPVSAAHLGQLVGLIDSGTISGKIAKEILGKMIETGESASDLVSSMDLFQISDEDELLRTVRDVLTASASQVAAYRGGKAATFGWFVGQVMKATGGKAAPSVVNRLLKEELDR